MEHNVQPGVRAIIYTPTAALNKYPEVFTSQIVPPSLRAPKSHKNQWCRVGPGTSMSATTSKRAKPITPQEHEDVSLNNDPHDLPPNMSGVLRLARVRVAYKLD